MAYLNYVTELYPDSIYPERMSVSRRQQPLHQSLHGHPRGHHHHHHHHHHKHHPHHGPPEPDSPLHRFNAAYPPRSSAARATKNRFKTQPITFDEIKEVDEEEQAAAEEETSPVEKEPSVAGPSDLLKSSLTEFSQAMEGLVALKFDSKTAESHERAFAARKARLARVRRRKSTPDSGLLPEEEGRSDTNT